MAAFAMMFVLAIPGPFIPAINTEVLLLLRVLREGQDPVAMVLAAASGHMTLYVVLHALGEKTLMRFKPIARRLTALTDEKRERFRRGATAGLISGALLGIPPVIVLAPLASSIGYSRSALALIAFAGRAVRFGVLVSAGEEARAWFGL